MRYKTDELAERVTDLEKQVRNLENSATRRLDAVENAIRYLAVEANEETRRKLGRLGFVLPGKPS